MRRHRRRGGNSKRGAAKEEQQKKDAAGAEERRRADDVIDGAKDLRVRGREALRGDMYFILQHCLDVVMVLDGPDAHTCHRNVLSTSTLRISLIIIFPTILLLALRPCLFE